MRFPSACAATMRSRVGGTHEFFLFDDPDADFGEVYAHASQEVVEGIEDVGGVAVAFDPEAAILDEKRLAHFAIWQFWGNPMDHRLGFEDVEECRLVDNGEPLANVLEEIGPGFDIDGGLIGHREGDGRRSEVATELVGGP